MDTGVQHALDSYFDELGLREQYNGVIRITHRDRVIYERGVGYADCETRTEFGPDSIFRLYSITKAFCAIGLMKLVDRGLVDLDRHPGAYVPEAQVFDRRVTIRHLLQHTSGIPDFAQDTDMRTRLAGETSRQLRSYLKELSSYPMHFDPGAGDFYSNINYMLVSFIIEELSGQTFADYLAKEVLAPLGAATARIPAPGEQVSKLVTGHALRDNRPVPASASDWMYGAGDLVGSVDDVYTLNLALKKNLLLSEKSWQLVTQPSPVNHKGFGCTVTAWGDKRRIVHNGGAGGFRTYHVHIPEDDFDLIILSNSGWGNHRVEINNAVFGICYGAGQRPQIHVAMDAGYI